MIEIIALIFLTRKIGSLATRKGMQPGRWKLMMVLAWFACEIIGLMIGVMISQNLVLAMILGIASAFGGYLLVRYRLEQFPDAPDNNFLENLGR